MKTKIGINLLVILTAFLCAGFTFAGDKQKMVIELKTNDFEMAETDISDLAIGESETIVTESGKTIDLLRTAEGVEVYVDGELLETPDMNNMELHGEGHGEMHKLVIIECEVDDASDLEAECGEDMVFISDGDFDMDMLHEETGNRKVIVKRIHSDCASEEEGDCEDQQVWISDGEDFDMSELHEVGEGHKVIEIHTSHDSDVDVHVEKIVNKVVVKEKG